MNNTKHDKAGTELEELLSLLQSDNTGTSENHEEFKADRVLTEDELIRLVYHDLNRWVKVKAGSDAEKLKSKILEQIESIHLDIKGTEMPEGVDIGWIIQEHICAETGDYSFGVYENPKPVFVSVRPGQAILPCFGDEDEMTELEKENALAGCPIFDITNEDFDVNQSLLSFFDYYASAPSGTFNLESRLIDDVEFYVAGDAGDARLFTTADGEGGIPFNGVMIATLIMFDLSTLTGIEVVTSAEQYTFECEESDFGNYYECKTIGDMAKILNDVKARLNNENC